MPHEYVNVKIRRSWSPERRARDKARRERGHRYQRSYVPNPVSAQDTGALIHEELEVVNFIKNSGETWVKMWPMLNMIARTKPYPECRVKTQTTLALVTRMITEKKLIRHRKSNTVALAPWLCGIKCVQEI